MSGVNYVAYTIIVGLITVGISVASSCNIYNLITSEIGPRQDTGLDYKSSWGWYGLLFLFSFSALMGPLYIYIDSGSGTYGDASSRSSALIAALAIFMFVGYLNWVYKVYVFVNREVYLNFASLVAPMTKTDTGHGSNGRNIDTAHWVLLSFNGVAFVAILVGTLVYLFASPFGWHNDASSMMLLVSAILIALTFFMVFLSTGIKEDKNSVNKLQNFSEEELINETVTATGVLIKQHAVKVSDPKAIQQINNYRKAVGQVAGLDGDPMPKNSFLGGLISYARTTLNDEVSPLGIRRLDDHIWVMPAHIASVVDHAVNESAGDVIELPPMSATGNHVVELVHQNDLKYKKRYNTDKILAPYYNPAAVNRTSDANPLKAGSYKPQFLRVTLIRDLDLIGAGYFLFLEDVWGICDGIAIHVKFSKTIVVPFVSYLFSFYIFFVGNTMYGIIAWLVTVFPALVGALGGTFSQFWDLFIHTFVIGWSVITMVKLALPGQPTYLYSNDVWNNTHIVETICGSTCSSLDGSTTYYWSSIITILLSIIMFIYEMVYLLRKKGYFRVVYLAYQNNLKRR
jgi:hypothetical protein